MDINKVIETIEKLSAYTIDNCSPGEFEAAQLKIQELITRYQIDQAQIKDNTDAISCHYISMPKNNVMLATLLNTIAEHNFCKVLRSDSSCLIYGYDDDIQICISLYNVLSIDMKLSHDRNKPNPAEPGWSKSFYIGYCIAIDSRLEQAKQSTINTMQSSSTSIMLAVKNKQHEIEEFYQSLGLPSVGKHRASSLDKGYISGHASGLNADIGQTRIEE
jgi:hypothetical protein